jgi:hypothetical protein
MSSTLEQSWPFLAILMSAPPPQEGDGAEPPRIRGLGFLSGDVIVTLAHIARDADIAELQGATMALTTDQTVVEGDFALMKLSGSPGPRPTVRPLSAGEPVTVALVSDISPSVRLVSGHGAPDDPDERFTVTLDGFLGEDQTASGSPVVAGDAVVGIVSPFATSGSVSAFGADAVQRLLEAYEAGLAAGE